MVKEFLEKEKGCKFFSGDSSGKLLFLQLSDIVE